MQRIFITGTGTQVGKTIISAIVTESLQADYWKPVQAGFEDGTDLLTVKGLISNRVTTVHPEIYRLSLAASPHIAAREESMKIRIEDILRQVPVTKRPLIIEGAGGIMVPLNENEFVLDLVTTLDAGVIIVSKNELGSINHSLMTAAMIKSRHIQKAAWIFNNSFMDYEHEIIAWSGFPKIGSIPYLSQITPATISEQGQILYPALQHFLC